MDNRIYLEMLAWVHRQEQVERFDAKTEKKDLVSAEL
jgi:hypothetical protein